MGRCDIEQYNIVLVQLMFGVYISAIYRHCWLRNPNVCFTMEPDRDLDSNHAGSHQERRVSRDSDLESTISSEAEFAPIHKGTKPEYERRSTEDDLELRLSHRRSGASGNDNESEEGAQIRKLVSRMFGHERREHSEEEKTRHLGVVWKNLTVKGVGLGSVLQPTNLDILLGIPRKIKQLLTRGRKGAGAGKPTRTIIDDFTVCHYIQAQESLYLTLSLGLRPSRGNASCSWTAWIRVFYLLESHWKSEIRFPKYWRRCSLWRNRLSNHGR